MLQPDWALVMGIVIAGFSIPSIMSALTERRVPRASALTVLIAGGLILWALRTRPGGYTLAEIPEAFIRIVAQIIN